MSKATDERSKDNLAICRGYFLFHPVVEPTPTSPGKYLLALPLRDLIINSLSLVGLICLMHKHEVMHKEVK